MAIIQCMTTSFCRQILEATHDFTVSGDTFKLALYGSTATLGPETTAYTTTGEISATGYTAGGLALDNLGTSSAGTVGWTSFSTATWTGAGIAASGGLIYNSTAVGYSDPSVMVLNFGLSRLAVSGTFTITFPTNDSSNAILRINAPLA